MPHDIPPDVERLIATELASGRYTSRDDVLRQALQALVARTADDAAIAMGIADMEAGRLTPLNEGVAAIRKRLGLPDAR